MSRCPGDLLFYLLSFAAFFFFYLSLYMRETHRPANSACRERVLALPLLCINDVYGYAVISALRLLPLAGRKDLPCGQVLFARQ